MNEYVDIQPMTHKLIKHRLTFNVLRKLFSYLSKFIIFEVFILHKSSSFFTNNLKVSGLTRSQFNAIRLRNETSNESSRPAPTHDADQNCLTMKNPIKEIRAQ